MQAFWSDNHVHRELFSHGPRVLKHGQVRIAAAAGPTEPALPSQNGTAEGSAALQAWLFRVPSLNVQISFSAAVSVPSSNCTARSASALNAIRFNGRTKYLLSQVWRRRFPVSCAMTFLSSDTGSSRTTLRR
jgi:hypothetical protein